MAAAGWTAHGAPGCEWGRGRCVTEGRSGGGEDPEEWDWGVWLGERCEDENIGVWEMGLWARFMVLG